MRIDSKRLSAPLVGLTLAALVAVPVAAQEWAGRGRIQGTVTDPEGNPIEGAKVTINLTGRPDQGPEPITTDEDGDWDYLGLTNDTWRVTIEKEGYIPSAGTVAVSEHTRTPPVNIELQPIPEEQLIDKEAAEAKKMLERGNELVQTDKPAEARAEFEAALPKLEEKHHPMVLDAIASTHLSEGNPGEAIAVLEKAIALDPDNPQLHRHLAQAYYQDGQPEESIASLKDVLEARPEGETDVETIQLLADLLVREGREAEAEEYIAMLPEGTKLNPETVLNTGITFFNEGKMEKALEQFDLAVEQNPDLADAYYYRGLTHMNRGNNAEAIADFQKMLELAPEHKSAAEAKEFLAYLEDGGSEEG